MSEKDMKLAKTQRMIYVYDKQREEKRWVYSKYVESYPDLYTPVYYGGIKIEAEILDK